MQRIPLVLALLALVPAAGAATSRSVTSPAPVTALAFDASRVAYAAGFSARDCNRVYVWNLRTRGVSRLGRRTSCERTSTGTAIEGLAIARTRVLWLHYTGGNIRDWSLWTATSARPRPVRLRLLSREVDAPAPIVVGRGDSSRFGDLLPYAVGRTVIGLRANGSRRFTWTAPARVVALAAKDGELAVASTGGVVTVLDTGGRVLATERYGAEIDAVAITGTDVIVQRGRALEVRGGRVALYTLIADVKLADADGSRAVLVGGGKVRTFDLDSGLGSVAAPGSLAQLDGPTLATAAARTITVRRAAR